MLIDCDTCRAPVGACADCVMTALLSADDRQVRLDPSERDALGALARAGLVPPLRIVSAVTAGSHDPDSQTRPGTRRSA